MTDVHPLELGEESPDIRDDEIDLRQAPTLVDNSIDDVEVVTFLDG